VTAPFGVALWRLFLLHEKNVERSVQKSCESKIITTAGSESSPCHKNRAAARENSKFAPKRDSSEAAHLFQKGELDNLELFG